MRSGVRMHCFLPPGRGLLPQTGAQHDRLGVRSINMHPTSRLQRRHSSGKCRRLGMLERMAPPCASVGRRR